MKFGDKTVIDNLNFEVIKGETFGFLGSNGSGKTTTLRALLGIYEPTAGELLVDGKPYAVDGDVRIGYLPEERGLYKKETVRDTMVYFGELKGMNKEDALKFTDEYLIKVGLKDHIDTRVDKLSGGQQQKVQLGITIMNDPELLILDEPTKGFDPVNRKLLMDIIKERQANGATVMMVTHQMDEVEQICDRILLVRDGTAYEYGTVADIRKKHDNAHMEDIFIEVYEKSEGDES